MTYLAQENSRQAGQPVELYDFVLGGTLFRVCTSSDPQVYGGHTYTPLELSRDTIIIGAEAQSSLLQLTMPSSHALPQMFVNSVPGLLCSVTITRVHKTDVANELLVIFKGILRSVSFSDKGGVAQVALMSQQAALGRNIPRYTYQSLCNNVLYDRWCTLNSALFAFTGTASAVSGDQFTLAGINANGDTWSAAGFAVCNGDYRLILSQVGNVLTLLVPFNTDITGLTVNVFAGCDHSLQTCKSKFGNATNYNGFPYIPVSNPFAYGLQ